MQTGTLSSFDKLLIIPDYVDKVRQTKRQPDKERLAERVEMLKGQQVEIFQGLKEFLVSDQGIFVLEGFAGTGKTFLTATIMEHYLFELPGMAMAVSAPTNKAVKVLRKMLDYTHKNLQFATTYSVLGMKEQIDAYGKQDFVRDFMRPGTIETLKVLLVDEGSMLADKLFEYIYPYIERGLLKVIFVGDPGQIPPIGKHVSIPLDPDMQVKYNMKVMRLTEIIRQKVGNPIIDLTLEVRSNPLAHDPIRSKRMDILQENGSGVCFMGPDDRKEFTGVLKAYFTSENFRKDPDYAHIVAYKNETVDKFNRLVRRLIYTRDQAENEPLIIGEKLIANKPICETYGDRTVVVFNNSDEFEVMDFTIRTQEFWKEEYKYYDALVMTENDEKERIKILHPDSYDKHTEYAAGLKDIALARPKGSWQAADAWKSWYAFQDLFADVKYNYAVSAHKSQGSTYDNCIVVESCIDSNRNVRERNKIKYTAFSRPSHRLIIVE